MTVTSVPRAVVWTPSQAAMIASRCAGELATPLLVGVELDGPLDAEKLDAAYQTLQRRHPLLRLRFTAGEGKPADGVRPLLQLDQPGSQGDYKERLAQLLGLLGRPRNLASEAPLEALLVRLGPESHALMLALDHLVADAWALNLISREWSALYAGTALEEPPDAMSIAGSYWEEKRLASYQEAGRWLIDEMKGAVAPAWPLPAGYYGWAWQQVSLPLEFWRELEARAQSRRTTPFALGLASLGAALHELAGTSDVLAAAHASNRTVPQSERIVTMTYTTIPLRVTPKNAAEPESWAEAAQAATLQGLRRQHLPLALAQNTLLGNGLVGAAGLHFMLGCDRHPFIDFKIEGVTVEELAGPQPALVANRDDSPRFGVSPHAFPARVTVSLRETWTELQLYLHYDRTLGDRTATQLLGLIAKALVTQGGASGKKEAV